MIPMEFCPCPDGVPYVLTPDDPLLGGMLSGLKRWGVKTALQGVAQVRSGEVPEYENGMDGHIYVIVRDEVRYWYEWEPETVGTISLDDWEDCLRRFDAWMATLKFKAD